MNYKASYRSFPMGLSGPSAVPSVKKATNPQQPGMDRIQDNVTNWNHPMKNPAPVSFNTGGGK